jgi:hypothetical protein
MSCLQGQSQIQAAQSLLDLGPDGLQLTPGNVPDPEFREWLEENQVTYNFHHAFDWDKYRRRVWTFNSYSEESRAGIECLAYPGASVHPPLHTTTQDHNLLHYAAATDRTLEVMYNPTSALADDSSLQFAMKVGVPLAVDTSHLKIALSQGSITLSTLKALMNYENVREVHVSENDGRHDQHRPIGWTTVLTDVSKHFLSLNVPIVLECYMHRMERDERLHQVEILRSVL